MPRSMIDVATRSLANPNGATLPPELYHELWLYSGSYASASGTSNNYIQKGTTTTTTTNTGSPVKLFVVNSNAPSNTKYALEAALWSNNVSYTASATLWDLTANTSGGLSITSTSTTATVVRSASATLTSGHTYGVYISSNNASGTAYVTDVNVVEFSNQQSLAQGSLANITLGTVGQKLTEAQIPLWVYSSSYTGSGTNILTAGSWFAAKGSTSGASSSTDTRAKLHTLNANWPTSQKFAFEVSMYTSVSGYTTNAELWDCTAGSAVTGSQISTTSTTATVIRSGQFTLTPGHVYGITLWGGVSSDNRLTKAHLIPLFT